MYRCAFVGENTSDQWIRLKFIVPVSVFIQQIMTINTKEIIFLFNGKIPKSIFEAVLTDLLMLGKSTVV